MAQKPYIIWSLGGLAVTVPATLNPKTLNTIFENPVLPTAQGQPSSRAVGGSMPHFLLQGFNPKP